MWFLYKSAKQYFQEASEELLLNQPFFSCLIKTSIIFLLTRLRPAMCVCLDLLLRMCNLTIPTTSNGSKKTDQIRCIRTSLVPCLLRDKGMEKFF